MKMNRFEWEEHRRGECGGEEVFFVIAESDKADATGWAFFERSSWDILWVRVHPRLCWLARVFIEEAEQYPHLNPVDQLDSMWRRAQQSPSRMCDSSSKRIYYVTKVPLRGPAHTVAVRLNRRMGHDSPDKNARRVKKGLRRIKQAEFESLSEFSESEVASTETDVHPIVGVSPPAILDCQGFDFTKSFDRKVKLNDAEL